MNPMLIDSVAIADQETLPLLNQGEKGVFGSVGVKEIERDGLGAQGPEPIQGVLAIPWGLIDIADWRLTSQCGKGVTLILTLDSFPVIM